MIELLPDTRPIKVSPHHMPPDDDQMLAKEIPDMASKGILRKVRDPKWAFPFFVAKGKGRKSEKKGTAVDFRRLNPMLKVVNYAMPTIEELIDSVAHDSSLFSVMDIAKA